MKQKEKFLIVRTKKVPFCPYSVCKIQLNTLFFCNLIKQYLYQNLLTTYCNCTNYYILPPFFSYMNKIHVSTADQGSFTTFLTKHCYKNLNDKFVYKHKEINSIEFETRDAYSCLLTMLRLINWFPPRHFLIGYWAPGATRIAVSTSPIHAGWIGYYVSSQQLDKSSHNT